MNVYVAFACIDYEGDIVLGVYSTKDKANDACRIHLNENKYADNYSVVSMKLDEYIEPIY